MCDYGNVNAPTMEERYEKLTNKVRLTMGRGQISFVLGGTKDLVPYCVRGIVGYPPGLKMPELKQKTDSTQHKGFSPEELKAHKVLIVAITPSIDADANEISSSSKYIWRKVLEDPSFVSSGSHVVIFGASGLCDKDSYDYFTSKGGSVVWLDDVRRQKTAPGAYVQTQAGRALEELLAKQAEHYEHIYVSFNLESITVSLQRE